MTRDTYLRQILALAETVAVELVAEAVDPAMDLSAAERKALVRLALSVEAEAARTVGLEPRTAETEAVLLRETLAMILEAEDGDLA